MEKTQRNNIMLAFFTLLAVIVIVSIIGFFTLGKGPEIIQGQAEATEYRVSSKVPGRILKFFVSEGDKVKAGEHGNLHMSDSLIPLTISGPGIPDGVIKAASLVDVVPTVGKILGFDTPTAEGKSLI